MLKVGNERVQMLAEICANARRRANVLRAPCDRGIVNAEALNYLAKLCGTQRVVLGSTCGTVRGSGVISACGSEAK
jgi:hypothetical protein